MRRITVTYVVETDEEGPVVLPELPAGAPALRAAPAAPHRNELTPHDCAVVSSVLVAVYKATSIPDEMIMGRGRHPEVTRARHLAIYLVRCMTTLSFPSIGRVFGVHHTTAHSAFRKIEEDESEETRRLLTEAEAQARIQ